MGRFEIGSNHLELIYLVGVRIDHMDTAGHARIKGVDGAQNFQGLLGIGYRRADKRLFHRTQLALVVTGTEVPG